MNSKFDIIKIIIGLAGLILVAFAVVLFFWSIVFQDAKNKNFEKSDKILQWQIDNNKKEIDSIKLIIK